MKLYKYGNPESDIVLIEPVGAHNLNEIPNQVIKPNKNITSEILKTVEKFALHRVNDLFLFLAAISVNYGAKVRKKPFPTK